MLEALTVLILGCLLFSAWPWPSLPDALVDDDEPDIYDGVSAHNRGEIGGAP
jgi:hypothetical protein